MIQRPHPCCRLKEIVYLKESQESTGLCRPRNGVYAKSTKISKESGGLSKYVPTLVFKQKDNYLSMTISVAAFANMA